MHIVEKLNELRAIRASMTGVLGLVPTMGALHAGHASLFAKARSECAHVAGSIFVNPTQFGPTEDLSKYPRSLQNDLDMLESLGVDVVWIPYVESIYPPGYQTWVAVDEITRPLEGKSRPGHFRGVATIVAKLFNCFTPDKAYFGQKDAQQVSVLKRMAQDLNFPVELVICPTVRDSDGLALSSRNAYLNPQERKAAPVLYRALCAASRLFEKGERNADALRETMLSELHSELFAREEYVSAADPDTMKELETISDAALLSMAVRIGATRLIDNVLLRVKQQ